MVRALTASILGQGDAGGPIEVDASWVYFINGYEQILRIPKTGGSAQVLGSGISSASSLRASGSLLYFTGWNTNTVNVIPKTGGTVTVLASANSPVDLALDGSFLYWIEYSNPGSVNRVPLLGGAIKSYFPEGNTRGIEVDQMHVYWAVSTKINQGKIMRAPK